MNLDKLIARQFPAIRATYAKRDTMLYALGVSACQDILNADELKFVYEGALQALPSLSCVLAHPGFWVKAPELEVNWMKMVHAEQHFTLTRTLPPDGEVIGSFRITGVVDKGADSGAIIYFEKTLHTVEGATLGTVESAYFLRGDGGCGNWGRPARELPKIATNAATGSIDIPTLPISALIYRLSGDYNPLHADPMFARRAGFDRPILQGLCTYGVACLALVRAACNFDAGRLISMGARFTKPVYPGETIRTEYWEVGADELQFRSLSVERNEVVLDRGVARIKN